MDSKKEKSLKKTYAEYIDLMLYDFPLDRIKEIVADDVTGYGTTIDEKVLEISRIKKIVSDQREQGAGIDMQIKSIPVHRRISPDEDTALFMDEFELSMDINGAKNVIPLRLTSVFEFIDNNWKLVHLHGSKAVETENDTWHLDEWKQKNEQLQKLVDEKTTELTKQYRELEIEAALDKVRARMLKMKNSSELEETTFVLTQELKSLGIVPEGASVYIVIVDSITQSAKQWIVNDESVIIPQGEVNTPLNEHPLLIKTYKDWKKKKPFLIRDLKGDKLIEFLKYFQTLPSFKDIEVKPEQIAERMIWSEATFSKGTLGLIHDTPLPQTSQDVLIKFSKVLDLTYQRFLDLQKAEAQAREAQIETALERIRNRTLLMKNSKELNEAVAVFFNEFKNLNLLPPEARTYFCDINTNNHTAEVWMTETDGKVMNGSHFTPLTKSASLKKYYKAWKNKLPISERVYTGKTLKEYLDFVSSLAHVKKDKDYQKLFKSPPKKIIMTDANFLQGNIGIMSFEKLSEEALAVLKRFAKVFEFTYTRFLDLQKAEAQTREAQIEVALERVRAASMAMHRSDELPQVALSLLEQLDILGISDMDCGINIVDSETKNFISYSSNRIREGNKIAFHQFPEYNLNDIGFLRKTIELLVDAGKSFYTLELRDELFEEIMQVWKNSDYPGLKNKHLFEKQKVVYLNAAKISEYSSISTTTVNPLSEEQISILRRMAKTFSMSYTRFLDLQKAEAQAREAEIQLAIERVRAKTMAMQKSEELADVALVLFQQVKQLGIETWSTGFNVWLEGETSYIDWVVSTAEGRFMEPYTVDLTAHPFFMEISKARKRGDDFFMIEEKGETLAETYRLLFNMAQIQFEDLVNAGFQMPEHQINHYVFGRQVSLMFITFDPCPEAHEIFKRLGKAFDQTYTRFLDLQKAETQAQEARIEASLERVRSRTMGMQKSSELQEVINRIFIEMTDLGIQIDSSYIITHLDEEINKGFYAWVSINEQSYASKLHQAYLDHPLVHRFYKAWYEKEPHFAATFSKAEKNRYFRHQFKHSPQLSQIPKQRKDHILDGNGWSLSWVIMKNAAIVLQRYQNDPFHEEEINIQKRFAKVFEQTYTRFLDLQRAESQAREAVKQASLDRVRGEIASMRTKDDLNRITPLIWKELIALGVPFIRCGVFIMDDENQNIHTFLSTPTGESIAAFHLPYDTPGNFAEIVSHWKRKKNYIHHWDEKEFQNLADVLLQKGSISSRKQYMSSMPKEGIHLNFLPFLQGMLYVGNSEPLNDEDRLLVQSLASAFSTAYARYEDFNSLESAKDKIEHTLTELKSAQSQLIQAEKMASLGELTAGIAHEIQNPLNFVNNFSELSNELLDELKEEIEAGNIEEVKMLVEDVIQNLEKINNHGQRASSIVKGMLQHSRTSSGQKEPTDINALADEYLRLSFHGFRAKDKSFNADFKLVTDESIPKINVISQDIGRVLLNLINNAFYACAERSRNTVSEARSPRPKARSTDYQPKVKVSTKKLDNKIEIRVKDNGKGIPQNIVDKIFQPFFTTKPTGQGTGLGLSLSYDIVKAHGGTINVESKENEGTEFIIEIPLKS